MFTATFLAATTILSAPPTKTTPLEVLKISRFNAAQVDDLFLHHWVDLTGIVTEVERDGIGGYNVKIEARLHEPDFLGRIEIVCHFGSTASYFQGSDHGFAGNQRKDLAQIKPGVPVTIRGIPRKVKDHLHFPIDRNIVFTMKDCELVAGAE
ncbi:MAG: hypothetical protein SFU86_05405 [Pirellulaceae bacterium]|nr:hypothetical protein [Pirellulaceae bacterium]